MKRLLSYLVLLMLFATGSYATVPLTADMWQGGGDCAYNLNVSTEEIYGLGTPDNTKYADLSGYSKLILTVSSGQPRLFFNTVTYNGDRLTVGPNAGTYMTVSGNTYTVDLNAIWFDQGKAYLNSIKGGGWGSPATITSMELVPYEGTPVKWNVDNGISINDNDGLRNKFNTDDPIIVPVRNSSGNTWSVNPRFKVKNADTEAVLQVGDLCGNDPVGNYFKVIYSVDGILQNTTFGTAGANNNTETYPQIKGLTANKRGEVSMTVIYKGNDTYNPYSKTYNFVVEGMPTHFEDWNPDWVQNEKYLDDGEWRKIYGLFTANNQRVTMATLPTVTAVDALGEPITSKVVNLASNSGDAVRFYSNSQGVDIHLIPNTLGTVTYKVEYPGDDIYGPATYMFDVTIKQHMVDLKWVNPQGNETDEWVTNMDNQYNGIPMLKMYIDNNEVNPADYLNKLQFTSSNEGVAKMNSNAGTSNTNYVDWIGPGMTVIEARFLNSSKQVDGLNYYYYNDEATTYTMILEVPGATGGPRIVWISGGRDNATYYGNTGKQARGSYLGQKFIDNLPYGQTTGPINISAGYGNDVFVSAVALKSWVTDDMLASKGIKLIPNSGYADHFYVIDLDGGWRASKEDCIPAAWRFDYVDEQHKGDPYFTYINYMVNNPTAVRTTEEHDGTNNNNQSWYKIVPAYPSHEPLKIYASVNGHSEYSYTPVLVSPGELQLHFVPDQNTVNEGYSILPYVNCPDLRMEDVNKIWLTYDCPNTLFVDNDGVVYETGKTTQTEIAKYLFTVTANDTIWKQVDDPNNYYADGTPNLSKIQELRPTTWLRGINPEIFGKANAAGQNCTVTLHLTSEMYNEATADYTLFVVGDANSKPMFHWEMNDKVENGNHVDDGEMKTITVVEGDFIYMPGIVGNANGNKEYSQPNTYNYLYAIKNGQITMNRAKYFPGEGVPNYYLTTSEGGNPAIPHSGDNLSSSQSAIITWSHGLGNYWRNDSLMIYGNKAGEMYLYAEDAQTHKKCTPIKLVVLPKQTLYNDKQTELAGMTYPFTWDFEHMDMTEYIADATENGGTYWRERWDERKREDTSVKTYNRHYNIKKDYYQYNGGMNADWDDKDDNGTGRQRWFKDIYANGKYVPEFKGIMLNLSGLDYWEQKFQRFNIAKDGKCIFFEGGPIFIQLPGFGLLDKKTGIENAGTREYDNYIGGNDKTKGWHNHINTAGFNVNEGYTQMLSVDNTKNKDVTYPVQEKYRNNKVRFVIKARGGRVLRQDYQDEMVPNENPYSQFHIGGASMLNENLNVNDIRWSYDISDPTVHNGYSVLNLDDKEAKVYIVELDPYDPELQDHIYLMFNNDVYVYWMAITNEPRNILSDFDGVTYSYPKDIDMEKTNLTLKQQTTEGIYTKASNAHDGTYALASVGQYTKKGVYKVPGAGEDGVQLQAYTVNSFDPSKQAVTLTPIEGNIPKNEGVMLYSTPRMSALESTPEGLEAAVYNRGTTAYSVPYDYEYVNEKGETVITTKYNWYTATEGYNNVHNYYYLPLYFIAQAENMSTDNYIAPESTYGDLDITEGPTIEDGHVTTPNLLRPTTYGQVLGTDNRPDDQPAELINDNDVIHFGYNNEFICRNLVYVDGTVTKKMDPPYVTRPDGAHEDVYYYEIGIDFARFYRINSPNLNHHNRSAYMTLTWNEYTVHTEGKPLSIVTTQSNNAPKNIRFGSKHNPIDLLFANPSEEQGDLVSEDGGFSDGINEVEQVSTTGDKVYNLNGVQVNALSKGVYIINGKKVVVK